MAGQPGMNIGRTRKAAEKDAIALAFLEQKMDEIARNACTCVECGKDIENKDIPPQAVKVMQMRYDKLRPSLSAVTQETIQHETRSETDILGQFKALAEQNQEVRELLLGVLMGIGQSQQSVPDNAPIAVQHGDKHVDQQTPAS